MSDHVKDKEALENALLAIDGSVRTLLMARTIIEDRLTADRSEDAPNKDPFDTMGGTPDLPNCEHLNCTEKLTMGKTWWLCQDCKTMIDPDE